MVWLQFLILHLDWFQLGFNILLLVTLRLFPIQSLVVLMVLHHISEGNESNNLNAALASFWMVQLNGRCYTWGHYGLAYLTPVLVLCCGDSSLWPSYSRIWMTLVTFSFVTFGSGFSLHTEIYSVHQGISGKSMPCLVNHCFSIHSFSDRTLIITKERRRRSGW